jgi:excinuclease UvrABC helicase subunit UvrB
MDFKITSEYQPTGDQPQAIDLLVHGFSLANMHKRCWALLVQVKHLPLPM